MKEKGTTGPIILMAKFEHLQRLPVIGQIGVYTPNYPPKKKTCPWQGTILKGNIIFKPSIFRRYEYVSFHGGNCEHMKGIFQSSLSNRFFLPTTQRKRRQANRRTSSFPTQAQRRLPWIGASDIWHSILSDPNYGFFVGEKISLNLYSQDHLQSEFSALLDDSTAFKHIKTHIDETV